VSDTQDRILLSALKRSSRRSVETSDAFHAEAWPDGKRMRDGLSFLFVKSTTEAYPDTGESGDTYDAEALLDY
jgi:hypothetical protein